jgi:hypothetical protein
MGVERYDSREFESTFFALRIALLFAALLVISAPVSVKLFDDEFPPTVSDSWYTDARMIFVLGLAVAGGLLVVVRGDTLTEQTLLNVAGGLALVVAGAACWPKGASGQPLKEYDPQVADLNEFAIGAILAFGLLAWLAALFLPRKLVGTDWTVKPAPQRLLEAVPLAVLLYGVTRFSVDRRDLAEHVHGPSAIAMFVLLGLVAVLRTRFGLWFLRRIGDTPVDESLSTTRPAERSPAPDRVKRFDAIYGVVGILMITVVILAGIMRKNHAEPGWLLPVEIALLVLFGVFWTTQTVEGWLLNKERRPAREH